MAAKSILVIGATGNVGGAVAARLARTEHRVRAMVRDPRTARLPEGVAAVRGDLTDTASLHDALVGIDAVFLVWPLNDGERAVPVVGAIAEHASRVVYLSSDGVRDDGGDAGDPINQFHTDLERAIRASGLEWTFLRSGGMAANTLAWKGQIRENSVVRWPYGKAARSLVHEDDLAEIGELALTTDGLVGAAPILTGPTVLTQIEQAAAIGDAIGRPVRWEEPTREEAKAMLVSWGWPEATADGALDAWAASVGEPDPVTTDFTDLTGRPGCTFQQWAADHAADFR